MRLTTAKSRSVESAWGRGVGVTPGPLPQAACRTPGVLPRNGLFVVSAVGWFRQPGPRVGIWWPRPRRDGRPYSALVGLTQPTRREGRAR
jgi:hypothetical protein